MARQPAVPIPMPLLPPAYFRKSSFSQIADALRANATRVLDLFRSWDADGDGEVSRKEFHKAMPALGLEVPKADVDELFNLWDNDGGGSLAYKELKTLLSKAPKKNKLVLSGDPDTPLSEQV